MSTGRSSVCSLTCSALSSTRSFSASALSSVSEQSSSTERAKLAWAELRGLTHLTMRSKAEAGGATAKVAPTPEAAKPVLVDHMASKEHRLPTSVWRDGAWAGNERKRMTALDAIKRASSAAASPLRRMSRLALPAAAEGKPTFAEEDEAIDVLANGHAEDVETQTSQSSPTADRPQASPDDESGGPLAVGPEDTDCNGHATTGGGDPLRMSGNNLDTWKAQVRCLQPAR